MAKWKLRNLPNIWRGLWKLAMARWLGMPHLSGALWLRVRHEDGSFTNFGLASLRVVTTAGVNYIVDAFQNTVELESLIYHGFGTGVTSEAVGDTDLEYELTTEYPTDNTRVTGTNQEGASANIYRTQGTLDPDEAAAVTEHGVFNNATVGSGTLLDRSVFAVINLGASGDTLEATYDLTLSAGG